MFASFFNMPTEIRSYNFRIRLLNLTSAQAVNLHGKHIHLKHNCTRILHFVTLLTTFNMSEISQAVKGDGYACIYGGHT